MKILFIHQNFPGQFKFLAPALAEAGHDVVAMTMQKVEAASWQPSPRLEALSRINPLQQIPTLRLPDGRAISESAAILIHLGLDAAPGSGLLPAEAGERAQALSGLVYVAANCYAAIGVIDNHEGLKQLQIPALIIVGDQDQATPPAMSELIHEHWPQSKYTVLKDAAHLSSVEQAEAFNQAVMQFLPH